jgi:N-methylhydantoinase B
MEARLQPVADPAVMSEVLANLFQAVVDEMAWIVVRSAHTTFVKETQDFGAALLTASGEMFAYPFSSCATSQVGIPVGHALHQIDWQPGDIVAVNDPFSTAGMVMHLNDMLLIRPVFHENQLLCFTWGFLHLTDVGGYAPGSIDMRNSDIFQEGLRLGMTKLFRDDELNDEIWNIIAGNSRIPELNRGDVMALVSALRRGEQRMLSLVERYGVDTVRDGMENVIDATEHVARDVLSALPAGTHRFVDYFEDDYVSDVPVRLSVAITPSRDGTVTLDYTDSDPQVQAALNLPTGGQKHHPFLSLAVTNYVVTQAPTMHINGGVQRCIELVLPEASVVNAEYPAAVGMRWSTAMRGHDLVLGALHAAAPGSVPAAGAGQVVITYVSTIAAGRGGRVVVANPVVGGTGGGPELDGVTGIDFPCAFLRNVPVEVLEAEVPVVVERFAAVPDSEGPGRLRGGFGVEYAMRLGDQLSVVVMRGKDRHRFAPWGVAGGRSGSTGACHVTRPDNSDEQIGKVTLYRAQLGEVVHIQGSGGGGYGDPLERPVDAVATDVRNGLVSAERAESVYGVVFADGRAELELTEALRTRRSAAAPATLAAIDLGPGRLAWQTQYGELSDRLAGWLPSVPKELRHQAKTRAYEIAAGKLELPDAELAIDSVIAQVERQLGLTSQTSTTGVDQ